MSTFTYNGLKVAEMSKKQLFNYLKTEQHIDCCYRTFTNTLKSYLEPYGLWIPNKHILTPKHVRRFYEDFGLI